MEESIELVKDIYAATADFLRDEIYGLTNQMRRSAVSIPSILRKAKRDNTRKSIYSSCTLLWVFAPNLRHS